jgi:uncharacterized protein (TIGR01244 family)
MADIRIVTDSLAVAPQLAPEELGLAADLGYSLVINNRPDGEQPGQPTAAQMEAAARAAGLAYVHIPVVGAASPEQVAQMTALVADHDGKVLAFCRSGTRSITTWARGRAAAGDDRGQLLAQAAAAGYDLSAALG